MKKLQIISTVILFLTVVLFLLWRFVVQLPDWLVRVNCVLMMVTIFTTVFSTVRVNSKLSEQK